MLQLLDAYHGKAFYVEYWELLKVSIAAGFTRSNGEPLLYLAKNVVPFLNGSFLYFTWIFYPLNPWSRRIDHYNWAITDTGVRRRMLYRHE